MSGPEVLDRIIREVPMGAGHIRALVELKRGLIELTHAAKVVVDHDRLHSLCDRDIDRLDAAMGSLGQFSAAAIALAVDEG